jgi:hypothetical protein
MRYALFSAYWLQTLAAILIAPVMRATGFRFGKSWRGNLWVNHVHANMLADGYRPAYCKFFNRYV